MSGAHDSVLGATRKQDLENAAALLGSWLGHSATIQMDISSVNTSTSGYASASPVVSKTNGFNKTVIQNKIQTNGSTDQNGSESDGSISFNFFYNWNYGNTIASNAYDFKSMALKELTHTLGFFSGISELGQGLKGSSTDNPDAFLYFDQFLVNSSGAPLVYLSNPADPFTATFDADRFSDLTTGVYFKGTQAVAAFGGNVPLYSPDVWEEGKSLSSLDDGSFSPDALMESGVQTGLMARSWNPTEIGIMKDLGYTIVAIPEPRMIFMLISFVGFFAVMRMKKKSRFE